MVFSKMKKIMNDYRNQKLNDLDKNLIKGIYLRKLRDFEEKEKERLAHMTLLMRLRGESFQLLDHSLP